MAFPCSTRVVIQLLCVFLSKQRNFITCELFIFENPDHLGALMVVGGNCVVSYALRFEHMTQVLVSS